MPVPIAPIRPASLRRRHSAGLVVKTSKHWVLPPRPRPGKRYASARSSVSSAAGAGGAGARSESTHSLPATNEIAGAGALTAAAAAVAAEPLDFLKFDDPESSEPSTVRPTDAEPEFDKYWRALKHEPALTTATTLSPGDSDVTLLNPTSPAHVQAPLEPLYVPPSLEELIDAYNATTDIFKDENLALEMDLLSSSTANDTHDLMI